MSSSLTIAFLTVAAVVVIGCVILVLWLAGKSATEKRDAPSKAAREPFGPSGLNAQRAGVASRGTARRAPAGPTTPATARTTSDDGDATLVNYAVADFASSSARSECSSRSDSGGDSGSCSDSSSSSDGGGGGGGD